MSYIFKYTIRTGLKVSFKRPRGRRRETFFAFFSHFRPLALSYLYFKNMQKKALDLLNQNNETKFG